MSFATFCSLSHCSTRCRDGMQLMTNTTTTATCEDYWHLLDLFLSEACVGDGFSIEWIWKDLTLAQGSQEVKRFTIYWTHSVKTPYCNDRENWTILNIWKKVEHVSSPSNRTSIFQFNTSPLPNAHWNSRWLWEREKKQHTWPTWSLRGLHESHVYRNSVETLAATKL